MHMHMHMHMHMYMYMCCACQYGLIHGILQLQVGSA